MSPVTAVILAAGQGTRMHSRTPKMLHDLCGRPMVAWPIAAAVQAGADRVVVVGGPDGALAEHLPGGAELAVQAESRGTADAVLAAADRVPADGEVLVLSGDVPLVTARLLGELLATHRASGAAATVATVELEDPSGYGRIVRGEDDSVTRIVETKAGGDATEQELAIREVNAGVYVFAADGLLDALRAVGKDNAQGEYYLPDVLPILAAGGTRVIAAHRVEEAEQLAGVNDRVELAAARGVAQRRILEALMRDGVTVVDPGSTLVDADVAIGADTVIEPSSFLRGATSIGEGCRVGPLTTLVDVTLGDDVRVPHSYLQSCEVRSGASVGPFAYLRPGALLREGAKAGTFVEIKNSDIGPGAKVPHLSYIGDADVGEGTNLGAATITANYDGQAKHRTTIGRRVHTSVDTTLVAPVTVGDDAYTGAGSVITRDVPEGALGIARPRQTNLEGYAERRAGAPAKDAAPPNGSEPAADPELARPRDTP